MSDEKPYLYNKDHHFIAFEKWNPHEASLDDPREESEDFEEYEEDKMSIPDPVRTSYKIQQEISKEFISRFNFYDIHVKFHLSPLFMQALAECCGVEVLVMECTTPYRTRISIGRLFNETEVKQAITKLAEKYVNEHDELSGVIYSSKPVQVQEDI